MNDPFAKPSRKEQAELRKRFVRRSEMLKTRVFVNGFSLLLTLVFFAITITPFGLLIGIGVQIFDGSPLLPWVVVVIVGSYLALIVHVFLRMRSDRIDDIIKLELANSKTCVSCGYDLSGVPACAEGVRCPECGERKIKTIPTRANAGGAGVVGEG
jgi:predicted RNA-binding Zn-ribbon protein involved in translation (DUF1610 family)